MNMGTAKTSSCRNGDGGVTRNFVTSLNLNCLRLFLPIAVGYSKIDDRRTNLFKILLISLHFLSFFFLLF
jgi:hypothetical protein